MVRTHGILALSLILAWGCDSDQQEVELTEEERRQAGNALKSLEVHPDLEADLFASEPMLRNPTNMDIDSKGRVWVTEAFNYRPFLNPDKEYDPKGDRIVILEDTDQDGLADLSKVYYQDPIIDAAMGIVVLGNKVIVGRSPNVLVFTDLDNDDRPDEIDTLFTGIEGIHHDHSIHAFIFGPDGRLYFNVGDQGGHILTKDGQPIIDLAGNEVNNSGNPYRKGMAFRCNLDGSDFEVLGHNFRNPYEISVDSYGSIWQSDNDDDGNRAVRINYLMEYGNYGYTDEMTGAGWRARRTGSSDSIPLRHWHLNDPGVVPNVLQTGAGSPAGITVYEGRLLPEVFWDQIIHADAGPNVVRSYPVKKAGAGFTATTVNILKGVDDPWFRPIDVCIAPDGSLFVADWYDPGVGGHQVGDKERGRIYRLAPKDAPYEVDPIDVSSAAGAVEALRSPNMATRYMGWTSLKAIGSSAGPRLEELYGSKNPRMKARALWILAQLDNGDSFLSDAFAHENEDLRITAIRAARAYRSPLLLDMLTRGVQDPSIQVRREVAVALRNANDPSIPNLLVKLLETYDGTDPWYLEAIGIGAAPVAQQVFDTWTAETKVDLNVSAHRDIIWRFRSENVLPYLGALITNSETSMVDRQRYFRALDFHPEGAKDELLVSILNSELGSEPEIQSLVLNHLSPSMAQSSPQVQAVLEAALTEAKGSSQYIDLVKRYRLTSQSGELKSIMFAEPNSGIGIEATWLLYELEGLDYFQEILDSDDPLVVSSTLASMSNLSGEENWKALKELAFDPNREISVRRTAIASMAKGWNEEDWLLELLTNKEIPAELENSAIVALMNAYKPGIRNKISELAGEDERNLLAVPNLVSKSGDAVAGQLVFDQNCSICHQVNGVGTDFGPELSLIGDKLSRQAMYASVMDPDAGINFGYEGYLVETQNGRKSVGYIISQTDEQLTLKMAGGTAIEILKADISKLTQLENSLMPSGLHRSMSEKELVDLVEYLTTLEEPA